MRKDISAIFQPKNNWQIVVLTVLCVFISGFAVETQARNCFRCHGTGRVVFQRGGTGEFGVNNSKRKCPTCGEMVMHGVFHDDPCPACNGTGEMQSTERDKPSQRNSRSEQSRTSQPQQQYGLTPEQFDAALSVMNAQIRGHDGEEGSVNGVRVYGSCRAYNPLNHKAQPSVTDKIGELGRVDHVAFSTTGSIMTFDSYGFQCAGVPTAFIDAVSAVNRDHLPIRDVALSDNNQYWAVVYGADGGTAWRAYAPDEVYKQLNDVFARGSKISSVWLGGDGKFVVVGDDGIAYGTASMIEPINKAISRFGKVKSVNADRYGRMVICCERGVYCHYAPSSITDKLLEIDWLPRVVKFNYTGHYFIGGNNGQYAYWF